MKKKKISGSPPSPPNNADFGWTKAVLPLVSVYRLLVGIPTIRQIRGVFCEWAGLYSIQLIIASYAGSTAENGKAQTTMKHNYVFYFHFYVF